MRRIEPPARAVRRRALAFGSLVAMLALAAGPVGASDLPQLAPATGSVPPPLTVVLEDGGDGYVNLDEQTAGILVTGTYDTGAVPAIGDVAARIEAGPICDGTSATFTPGQTAAVNGDGTFSVGPFDVSGMPEGATLCARARAIDTSSATSAEAGSNTTLKDTVAPAAGTVEMVETFVVDGYLNDREATDQCCIQANWFTGDPEAVSATVWFEDAASAMTAGCGLFNVGVSGFGAVNGTCAGSMAQGPFEFLGIWRDAAGNGSAEASASLTKDTIHPPMQITSPAADGAAFAPSTTLAVSGTTVPGGPLVYRLNGVVIATGTAGVDGSWQATFTTPSLDGIHEFKATTRDAARNFSTRVRLFAVDSTIPTILSPVEGSLSAGAVSINGKAPSASTVEVFEGDLLVGSTQADATGDWSLVSGLTSGTHTIVARATTTTDVVSPLSAPRTFRVDNSRPVVTFTTGDLSPHVQGALIEGGATDNNEGVASIVVEYYDALGTRVLQQTAACTTCGAGALSVSWQDEAALVVPGPYTVVAYAVDMAGNRSAVRSIRILAG